jgi:GTP cyclohydrolase II
MVSQPLFSQIHSVRSKPRLIPARHMPIHWGAHNPLDRGALVGTLTQRNQRNVIGTHGGSYSVYRALSVASGQLDPDHRAELEDTQPLVQIQPNPAWSDADRIVSLDPWGASITEVFGHLLKKGVDLRPTIAITQAHLDLPEIQTALQKGLLSVDGKIVKENGSLRVTKIAIDPVWYLPGIAQRLGIDERTLRTILHEQTGGMFPEFINRPDLKVWLPPVGNTTVYILGDVSHIPDPTKPVTLRIHDECNGSDVFGSDICTCRPYLIQGIEECVTTAQAGGTGIVAYFRKEGRSLGEVTKFLVYNARKRQGDRADQYFERTECVAGVQDSRMQILMPDVLHWLGVKKIDRLVSMSDMKYDAIVQSGIQVITRVPLPNSRIPQDAWVEMEAKKAAGYYSESPSPWNRLDDLQGRSFDL